MEKQTTRIVADDGMAAVCAGEVLVVEVPEARECPFEVGCPVLDYFSATGNIIDRNTRINATCHNGPLAYKNCGEYRKKFEENNKDDRK